MRRQLEEEGQQGRREELKQRLKLATLADEVRLKKGFEEFDTHLAHCQIVPELPALPYTPGTYVILLAIRPEIKQALMGHGAPGQNYEQFLYELALMSPVPYLDNGPISRKPEILRAKKNELKRLNFSVSVDNRTLYKPILLPSGTLTSQLDIKEGEDYLITDITFNDDTPGNELRYHGYLYWQKSQNKPSAIRGIQLYIRNVGIGLYDETLLNFVKKYDLIFTQTGQISGEIYIEEGFRQALNVNRRSFRETEPHYVVLQQHIWRELAAMLDKSIEAEKQRKIVKSGAEEKRHLAQLSKLVSRAANGKLNLTITTNGAVHPVEVHNNSLVFDLESDKWAGTKGERLLAQKILLTMNSLAYTPKI